MKKTIWIIDHYSSEPKYGGIQRQFDFANELSRRGYKTIIVSSAFSHYTHTYISEEECHISQFADNAYYAYVHTRSYKTNGGVGRVRNMFSFRSSVLRNYKAIEKQLGKPDVVVGASVHPLAWLAAEKIAKYYGVKFVAEVRDFWPQMWIESGQMKAWNPVAIYFSLIERKIFRKADRIITSLYHGDKYICDLRGVERGKVSIIGQPMDCKKFDENRNKQDCLPDEIKTFISKGFICTFSGYFMEYEGVITMLEAKRILQNRNVIIKMVFVGSGQEEEHMKKYIEDNALDDVLIGGRISKEAVPALLSNSDVCMAHIEYKGKENVFKYGVSKNKINEYLYSGACTLFGFRFSDNEVVECGGGFQFEPFNSEDLANKIESFMKLPKEKQKEYGVNGRSYIRNKHSVERLTDNLLFTLFN